MRTSSPVTAATASTTAPVSTSTASPPPPPLRDGGALPRTSEDRGVTIGCLISNGGRE